MVGAINQNEISLMKLPSSLMGLLSPHSNFNFKAKNVRFHNFLGLTPVSFTAERGTTDYPPLTLITSNLSFDVG